MLGWDGVGHTGVGWMGHVGVGWVMQGWGEVGHAGVGGCVILGWDGS